MNRDNWAAGRTSAGEVAEFQGLYGAYHISEVLLQKIWLRREFDVSRLRTMDGRSVRLLHPGAWNRLSGPDFRGAKLAIGDAVITGDVEVHFRAEAWAQHRHQDDAAYENVVLHVVLFPPAPGAALARTLSGREIPVVALMDLLWHDLEEYAADDAVAALSGRDPWPLVERLLALPEHDRAAELLAAATQRWRVKTHFARLRVERLGWEEACHQTALEILGYRSNRVAMLHAGSRFPWRQWSASPPTLDDLVKVAAETWTLRGVRPANHPRLRLDQYRVWMARVPDWPRRLRAWRLPEIPPELREADAALLRRKLRLASVRDAIAGGVVGAAVGGSRIDTIISNFVLPFLAAVRGGEDAATAEILWRGWFPGDAPDNLVAAVRQLQPGSGRAVLANGMLQAMLDLQLAQQRIDRLEAPPAKAPPESPDSD